MKLAFVLLLLALPLSSAQAPDIGAIIEPVDQLIGDQVPPALGQVYSVLGQNITREDVRLYLDLNFTKVDLGVGGLLIGSGKAELQANVHVRGEMRVISSERIRAAIDGDNAYNITAQNATFLTEVFLPAEVFRATLSAEVVAAFQAEQERALRDYVANAAPELEVLGLDISWDNVSPLDVVGDTSLTEPPLVIELDATLQYVRVESVPSLLRYYFDAQKRPEDPKKAYIESLKEDNSDPLRTRDFFSAAAYDQDRKSVV